MSWTIDEAERVTVVIALCTEGQWLTAQAVNQRPVASNAADHLLRVFALLSRLEANIPPDVLASADQIAAELRRLGQPA